MAYSNFPTPLPPYFLIKISKEAQSETKEKIGSLYFPPAYAYMRRELQFGEILAIGEAAKEYMPLAEVGDYLLIHHFVSGKKSDNGYSFFLIDEDAEFNYYAVNAFEVPGEMPLSYAIAKGSDIIPNPDYIFLEVPKEEANDGEGFAMKASENGIYIPKEKKKTRDEYMSIMSKNMERIKKISNVIPHTPMEEISILRDPAKKERYESAIAEIKLLEAENSRISKEINKKKYEPFVVAAINPDWQSYLNSIGENVNVGDTIHFLNIAAKTTINFSGTDFIVARTKYFGCSDFYIKNAINGIELHNASSKEAFNQIGSR